MSVCLSNFTRVAVEGMAVEGMAVFGLWRASGWERERAARFECKGGKHGYGPGRHHRSLTSRVRASRPLRPGRATGAHALEMLGRRGVVRAG